MRGKFEGVAVKQAISAPCPSGNSNSKRLSHLNPFKSRSLYKSPARVRSHVFLAHCRGRTAVACKAERARTNESPHVGAWFADAPPASKFGGVAI